MKLICEVCKTEFEYPHFKHTCCKACSAKLGHIKSGSRSESIRKALKKIDKDKHRKSVSEGVKQWHKNMPKEQKQKLTENHRLAGLKLASSPLWKQKVSEGTKQGLSQMPKSTKEKLIETRRNISSSIEYQLKVYQTKKTNHSFKSSKPEIEIYKLLLQVYPDTIYQYRSKQYPFNCDFYIPSRDLYIEYQGNWTHGFRPYDKNNQECIQILQKWDLKIKESEKIGKKSYYAQAKYVWTILDVKKREVALKNNLNYIEFFNINEFMIWYEGEKSGQN